MSTSICIFFRVLKRLDLEGEVGLLTDFREELLAHTFEELITAVVVVVNSAK